MVSSLQWPEMKCHHRFTKLERHRFSEFVIYSDFDAVEFTAANRHVMRSLVRVPHDLTVPAGDVTDAQQRSFRIANNHVRCHVAVNVHEIQSAVRVECRKCKEIGFFRRYQFLIKAEKLHQFPTQNHHVFIRILYLHSDSIHAFDEGEFHRDVWYVGERSCCLMSQAGSEFVSVSIVTGFDFRLGHFIRCNTERTDPVVFISVVDVVPSMG
jgi:hypothetical protein